MPGSGTPTPTSSIIHTSANKAPKHSSTPKLLASVFDTLNIDNTQGGERPVHTVLLGAGIPIVEHLVNLDQIPSSGFFTFTAVPPKIASTGTFTVRAFATVSD